MGSSAMGHCNKHKILLGLPATMSLVCVAMLGSLSVLRSASAVLLRSSWLSLQPGFSLTSQCVFICLAQACLSLSTGSHNLSQAEAAPAPG